MNEPTLFGDGPASESTPSPLPRFAAKWQTDLIRKALDGQGLTTQAERGAKVVELAGRAVASLAELTTEEASTVLIALGKTHQPTAPKESPWESRDEDTWIDRL